MAQKPSTKEYVPRRDYRRLEKQFATARAQWQAQHEQDLEARVRLSGQLNAAVNAFLTTDRALAAVEAINQALPTLQAAVRLLDRLPDTPEEDL